MPIIVGEVLTLLLHVSNLNFIVISKAAKTEVSATKGKIKFVPIIVGENSFLLLHVGILNFISILKTNQVKTSAMNQKEI